MCNVTSQVISGEGEEKAAIEAKAPISLYFREGRKRGEILLCRMRKTGKEVDFEGNTFRRTQWRHLEKVLELGGFIFDSSLARSCKSSASNLLPERKRLLQRISIHFASEESTF